MKVLSIKYAIERKKQTKKIEPLNTMEAGFRNPTNEDPFGYIEIDSQGVIKQIQIRYAGDITIHEEGINENFKFVINYNTNFLVLSNKNKIDLGATILVKYTGFIKSIPKFRAFGFNNSKKFLTIKPPKSTIDTIDTNFEDEEEQFPREDVYVVDPTFTFRRPPSMTTPLRNRGKSKSSLYKGINDYTRIRKKAVLTNYNSKLPKSYMVSKYDSNLCVNCLYFNNNYCKLWRSIVKSSFICNSWANQKGVKKQFEVVTTFTQEN